jgi:DNA-binding transcriptional LysR family regulator
MTAFPASPASLGPTDQISVQQLRSFCLVFEKQSYAAAAREIGLAVPTLWEQVQALEKRSGTSLFIRRGRRIEATAAAGVLYDSLRSLLTGLDSTLEALRNEQSGHPQRLTLVTGARMMLEDLGQPLKQFRDRFPHVSLRLIHDHAGNAEALVMSGEADLALTLEPGPGLVGRGVNAGRAYRIDYLALVPKRHPLARKTALALADLVGYPLIVGHARTYGRQLLDQALHHEGLLDRAQIVVETDTSAFTIACVRANVGVGIVAGRPSGWLTRDLVARSLTPALGQAWIAFLWKRGRHLTGALKTLMELIRQAADTAQP